MIIDTEFTLSAKDLIEEFSLAKAKLIEQKKILNKKDSHKYPVLNKPFVIPENWSWVFLSDISIIQEGPGIRKYQYQDNGIQFLTVTNILEGSVDFLKSQKFISLEEYEEKYKHYTLNRGDIVTACSGASWGKSAIFESNNLMILNTSTLRLRFFNDLGDNQYLYYLTKTCYFKKSLASHSTGQQANYGYSHYSKIPIPIPPLEEQKQIVAILDDTFEAIDQAQANIKTNIENAKELFQSKLNEIFSQKGEGWEEKNLGDICENLDSKRKPITKNKRIAGNIPYYGASGIVDYVADYLFDDDLLLVSEDGANLLARTYAIAFSISGKNWVNNHAHVLKFDSKSSQYFIEYYLNSIKLDDYVSGMAQPKLNQRNLNSIKVPFPNLEMQEKIVARLDSLTDYNKELVAKYKQKLTNLEDLKKSLLEKAFAGELTNKDISA